MVSAWFAYYLVEISLIYGGVANKSFQSYWVIRCLGITYLRQAYKDILGDTIIVYDLPCDRKSCNGICTCLSGNLPLPEVHPENPADWFENQIEHLTVLTAGSGVPIRLRSRATVEHFPWTCLKIKVIHAERLSMLMWNAFCIRYISD